MTDPDLSIGSLNDRAHQDEILEAVMTNAEASESDDLEKRVAQFHALKLPGQPVMMHMGTLYLIHDLWREVQRLRAALEKANAEIKWLTENWRAFDKSQREKAKES